MTLYTIRAEGCDDVTEVVLDLTPGQAVTVQEVAAAVTAAGGGCQPVMSITEAALASDEVPF